MKNRMLFVAAVVFSFGAKAEAHHQLGKVYTLKETVHIEGKVVRFLFRNPHSYIFLREAERDEKTWSLEWASAKKLSHQGVHGQAIQENVAKNFRQASRCQTYRDRSTSQHYVKLSSNGIVVDWLYTFRV